MQTKIPEKRIDAYELLDLLEKEYDFVVEPPINVDEIASILGITVIEDIDMNHLGDTGYIKVENGKPVIWINSLDNMNPYRRRFTLAHELGHFCLHILPNKKDGMFVDTDETLSRNAYWDIKELQANKFAANLLMPIRLIENVGTEFIKKYHEKYGQYPTVSEFIESMSNIFEVSKQAMTYRLRNLGIIK